MKYADKLPFKTLVCSRPEQDIIIHFHTPSSKHTNFVLHNVEEQFVQADIKLFILESLGEIARSKRMGSWPEEAEIDKLVARSAKLFIYASTICQFLSDAHLDAEATKSHLSLILISNDGPSAFAERKLPASQ